MCFCLLHDKLFFSLQTFINGLENKQTNKRTSERASEQQQQQQKTKRHKSSQSVLSKATGADYTIWIEYNLFGSVRCDCAHPHARIRRVEDFHMGILGPAGVGLNIFQFYLMKNTKYCKWVQVQRILAMFHLSCRQLVGLKWINRNMAAHPSLRSPSLTHGNKSNGSSNKRIESVSIQIRGNFRFVRAVWCVSLSVCAVPCEIH